uniref:Histone-lysine N-methyltransferase SETMAR n=1 Tax=Caenorhabditis japonica TaxID=281687 RepID=A0A8R1E3B1_CAEJA
MIFYWKVSVNAGLDMSKTKFLRVNARPHVAKVTQQKIDELGWEVLPYPPYSPDLAPSDFRIFRSMQNYLAEKQFNKSVGWSTILNRSLPNSSTE